MTLSMKAKSLYKTLLAGDLKGWECWGPAASTCGVAMVPSDPLCSKSSSLPVQQGEACHNLPCWMTSFLVFPAGSEQHNQWGKLSSMFWAISAGSQQRIQRTKLNYQNCTCFVAYLPLNYKACAVLQGWRFPLLFKARTNFAAISRESCRNSSRYIISRHSSLSLISYCSCLLHTVNIGSFCREERTMYLVGQTNIKYIKYPAFLVLSMICYIYNIDSSAD